MPRPKLINPNVRLEVMIPERIETKVREQLYSELEGREPYGAMSELATVLFSQWLKTRGVEV